ncbi:C-terminal region of Pasteurella multocida toxin residues 569-1285 [Pseudomonas sp. ok272]|uniref:membrane-targeted effector domain-containing toxin n=1 Tax=unclassified Pseudomonas TaxID=196821 RepID=UPI0008B0253E|nr:MULTISPECIES: membrane-targeted effector domain-containing toxin [unclassified Pseudomonas]SEN63330.1 C-terminal region of Pasteurella multocida toxin residues 569-1285 [Pseudomonas sp. ok272]SFN42445.1 C-terminal region of Pasteurella multocida toxin residues 569-1285 [Pseudomonas sp. ok602]
MNSSDTSDAFLLPNPADHQALKDLIIPFVEACPDLHDMAYSAAQGILDKYAITDLGPDQVWWHRFNNTSVSSNTAFLFWEHYPSPIESLTLTQLVAQRFQAHDQDNADLLDSDGGFYNQDAHAPIYNETNEVKMYPSQVINDLWRINFHDRYWEKMGDFWTRHGDDYRTLAKLNFIAKALEEHDGSRLSNENLKTVLKAVAGNISWPITLDMLKAQAPAVEGLRVTPLYLGDYRASDILRIIDPQGRQILYTPGEQDAFHVFDSAHDLHWWLLGQNNHPDNRARFMAHFPLSAQQQDKDNVGLNHVIDLLYATWGHHDRSLFDQRTPDLGVDAFTYLRDSTRDRMFSDADLSLRSNGDLREKMWIGYLTVTTRLFGAMAVVGWPVALAAVGAGLANIGLNIDQAINGANANERKAGVLGAIFASLDTVFNALALGGSVELTEVQDAALEFSPQANLAAEDLPAYTATQPRIALAAPGHHYVSEAEDLLAPFQTNEVFDGLEVSSTEGKYRNVYLPEAGGAYIKVNDDFYLVRYVNEMQTWAIIDPANPFSFQRSVPVRLNAEGEWESLTRPGLYGGGKIFDKLPWGRSATPLPDVDSAPTPYDVPLELRDELQPMARGTLSERALDDQFVDITGSESALTTFKALRRTLYRDAEAFFARTTLAPKPAVPVFGPGSTPKDIIKRLLKDTQKLVIGENHASIGSKQFLIENMEPLAKQRVKTLYMEHLLTDFHQADLDLFNRDGVLSDSLESYLKNLDKGHGTDPTTRFTFLELVKSAQKNHIRVQAIDCAASYRSTGILGASANYRQKVMNYFAKTVIEADQAARGAHHWVTLVGDSHATTWDNVPGISELEGGIGLRVESSPPGGTTQIEVDPGRLAQLPDGLGTALVKNDLRLQLALPPALIREQAIGAALDKPGMLTLEQTGSQIELIHRSRDGSLVHTPIHKDGAGLYVIRPQWGSLSNRRFAKLADLAEALDRIGLNRVRVP